MFKDVELKRKLRRLKKLEQKLRFGDTTPAPKQLVWNKFFAESGKYSFKALLEDDDYRRNAFDNFITILYYQYFKERGMLDDVLDPLTLVNLGLPPDASLDTIKARFRALAKKHHPDQGGDHEKMIELLKQYKKLLEN